MIFTGDNKEITRIMTGDGKEIIEVRDGQGRIIYQTAVDMLGDSPLLFQGKGKPLSQYKIWGNSYQDGVPDPEHPVEVVSVGDLVMSGEHAGEYVIPVTVGNLLDDAAFHPRRVGIAASLYRAQLASIVDASTGHDPNTKQIKIGSNAGYVISFDTDNSVTENDFIRFALTNVDLSIAPVAYNVWTFRNGGKDGMLQPNQRYEFYIESTNHKFLIIQSGWPACIKNIKICATYPIYLSEPLRKRPSYDKMDELNYKTGTIIRRRRASVLVKTQFIARSETSACFFVSGPSDPSTNFGYSAVDLLCNRLLPYSNRYVAYNMDSISHGWAGAFICTLKFSTIGATPESTNAELKTLADAFFAANPTIVEYDLQTPTTEPITLPTILMINGQNTLTVDTTVSPSQFSITGRIKPSSSYGNLTDKNGTYILDKNNVKIQTIG